MRKYCGLLGRDVEILKIPFVITTLSVIQIICFVLDKKFLINLQMLKFMLCKSDQVWRAFTYQFLHADVAHLTMNLFIQLFLSIPLESYHNWWRVLVIYSSGVIFGALGHAFVIDSDHNKDNTVVGASAGVYALLFGNIAFLLLVCID